MTVSANFNWEYCDDHGDEKKSSKRQKIINKPKVMITSTMALVNTSPTTSSLLNNTSFTTISPNVFVPLSPTSILPTATTTISNSNDVSSTALSDVFNNLNLTLLSIIFILGIIGNALAIYIFSDNIRKRPGNKFNYMLRALAVVDLLTTVFTPGLYLYLTTVRWKKWHFGESACKILRSLPSICITLSQFILMLIAYQRYRVVSKPLERPITKRLTVTWFVVSTLISVALTIPWTLTLDILQNETAGLNTCTSTSQSSSKEGFILNFTFDVIMLTRDLCSCAYIFIYGRLTIRSLNKNKDFYSKHQRLIERMKNIRGLLNSIITVYFICVVPIDVFHVIYFVMRSFNVSLGPNEYSYLVIVLTFLKTCQAAQSSINPIIYSKRIQSFRRLFCPNRQRAKETLAKTLIPIGLLKDPHIQIDDRLKNKRFSMF